MDNFICYTEGPALITSYSFVKEEKYLQHHEGMTTSPYVSGTRSNPLKEVLNKIDTQIKQNLPTGTKRVLCCINSKRAEPDYIIKEKPNHYLNSGSDGYHPFNVEVGVNALFLKDYFLTEGVFEHLRRLHFPEDISKKIILLFDSYEDKPVKSYNPVAMTSDYVVKYDQDISRNSLEQRANYIFQKCFKLKDLFPGAPTDKMIVGKNGSLSIQNRVDSVGDFLNKKDYIKSVLDGYARLIVFGSDLAKEVRAPVRKAVDLCKILDNEMPLSKNYMKEAAILSEGGNETFTGKDLVLFDAKKDNRVMTPSGIVFVDLGRLVTGNISMPLAVLYLEQGITNKEERIHYNHFLKKRVESYSSNNKTINIKEIEEYKRD